MSQDEIAVMDGAKCILQLRGVRMRTPLSKITSTGEIEQRFRLN